MGCNRNVFSTFEIVIASHEDRILPISGCLKHGVAIIYHIMRTQIAQVGKIAKCVWPQSSPESLIASGDNLVLLEAWHP